MANARPSSTFGLQKKAALVETASHKEDEMPARTSQGHSTIVAQRYRELAANPDPQRRALARRQLDRLTHIRRGSHGDTPLPSSWAHVPLAALFAAQGNVLWAQSRGTIKTGHEPIHGSKSGTCVVIDPDRGLWFCRSCRRGGDAAGFLMALRGWDYRCAAERLRWQYGTARRPVLHVGGA